MNMLGASIFTPAAILERVHEKPSLAFNKILSMFPAVDRSSLIKQLSLHLPQYSWSENLSPEFIITEAHRLGSRLQVLRSPFINNIPVVLDVSGSLQDLQFSSVDENIAKIILDHFHYLLSFREQSIHLGLKVQPEDKLPLAMVTLSAFDLTNIELALPLVDGKKPIPIVLSRVFAFDIAPHNSISYLLSRVRTWIAVNLPEVNLLVTYLNPNLGFTGTTYKADNWTLLGKESGTKYYYLNKNYVTDRKIYKQFGQAPQELVESWHKYGITVSRHKLLPLDIYIRGIEKSKQNWHLEGREFKRWVIITGSLGWTSFFRH